MSLLKKYQKQIALALITSGVISSYPVNVQADGGQATVKTVDPTTMLGLPEDPTTEIGAPRSKADEILDPQINGPAAGDENLFGTAPYEVLGTTVAKAINYAQAMNISKLGGIEFNGDPDEANLITDPSDDAEIAVSQQKYVNVTEPDNAHAQLMAFFKPAVQSVKAIGTSLDADDLKSIRTKLNELVTNVENLPVADATGHTYYKALAELLQYIDTIDAHMDMTPELPIVDKALSDTPATGEPVELYPDLVLDPGVVTNPNPVLETNRIHVSQFDGADVPTNEYWIDNGIYEDLQDAIAEATTIAQNVHPAGLFATEALVHTPVIGTINNLTTTTDVRTADTKIKKPDGTAFGTPTGNAENYSSVTDMNLALNDLRNIYEEYVFGVELGTAEIRNNILNAQAKFKMAMAMAGMKGVADNSIKDFATLAGELSTLLDGIGTDDNIEEPDTDNTKTNTKLESETQKIYVYVRKATESDIDSGKFLSGLIPFKNYATPAVDQLIVCSESEAEDVALYVNPTEDHVANEECQLLSAYGKGTYLIAPIIKEDAEHVPTWIPGGEYQVAGGNIGRAGATSVYSEGVGDESVLNIFR
ncbi:hypothetical protein AN643_04005 [Candidatus Epulonipiscioides saccharophilum]|nr:hypothetical protein AN643_04005 [Epulopiscium sp. SCG-B10WGA-EpuloB]